MTPAERVRRLVESGSVAPGEGERLLAAMRAAPPRSRLAALVDPFDRFGGGTAALLGAAVAVASVAVSRLGVRFDGLLDLHVDRASVPALHVAIADQIAGWLLPAVSFWLFARVFGKHVRLLDFVGMTGLARLPLLVAALVLLPITPPAAEITAEPSASLLAIALIGLVFVVANVTLLYTGFRNASGLTGAKLVGGFIGLVVVVEALSKIALSLLL